MNEVVKICLRDIVKKNENVEKIECAEDILDVAFWNMQEMIELLLAVIETPMTKEDFYDAINEAYKEVCA